MGETRSWNGFPRGDGDGMGLIELDLCTVKGRLFELALRGGYEIEGFVDKFMASSVYPGYHTLSCEMAINRLRV